MSPTRPASPVEDDDKRDLPEWLFPNCKVTYEYQGEYHKRYIGVKDGVYVSHTSGTRT